MVSGTGVMLPSAAILVRAQDMVVGLRVGDQVFGQGIGCLATAAICDARCFVPRPATMTATEAATIPTVFLTAVACLEECASIGPQSTVLLHAATGGLPMFLFHFSDPDHLLLLLLAQALRLNVDV